MEKNQLIINSLILCYSVAGTSFSARVVFLLNTYNYLYSLPDLARKLSREKRCNFSTE